MLLDEAKAVPHSKQGNRRHQTSPSVLLLTSHYEHTPCWCRLWLADYEQIRRHSQNRKYITYCDVVRGGPSHGRRKHVAYRKCVKLRHVVSKICERANRQTDRQTDTKIAILRTPTGTKSSQLSIVMYNRIHCIIQHLMLAVTVSLNNSNVIDIMWICNLQS